MKTTRRAKPEGIPRIESLYIENYRALRRVDLDKLTPMTVLLDPNGSGKSIVLTSSTSCRNASSSACATPGIGAAVAKS